MNFYSHFIGQCKSYDLTSLQGGEEIVPIHVSRREEAVTGTQGSVSYKETLSPFLHLSIFFKLSLVSRYMFMTKKKRVFFQRKLTQIKKQLFSG